MSKVVTGQDLLNASKVSFFKPKLLGNFIISQVVFLNLSQTSVLKRALTICFQVKLSTSLIVAEDQVVTNNAEGLRLDLWLTEIIFKVFGVFFDCLVSSLFDY